MNLIDYLKGHQFELYDLSSEDKLELIKAQNSSRRGTDLIFFSLVLGLVVGAVVYTMGFQNFGAIQMALGLVGVIYGIVKKIKKEKEITSFETKRKEQKSEMMEPIARELYENTDLLKSYIAEMIGCRQWDGFKSEGYFQGLIVCLELKKYDMFKLELGRVLRTYWEKTEDVRLYNKDYTQKMTEFMGYDALLIENITNNSVSTNTNINSSIEAGKAIAKAVGPGQAGQVFNKNHNAQYLYQK